MKKFICISTVFLMIFYFSNTVLSGPAMQLPTEVTQPNGDVIAVTAFGDERVNGTTDEKGYMIVCDSKQYFRYISYDGETATLSAVLVGEPPPNDALTKKQYITALDKNETDLLVRINEDIKNKAEQPVQQPDVNKPAQNESEPAKEKNWFDSLIDNILNFFESLFEGNL